MWKIIGISTIVTIGTAALFGSQVFGPTDSRHKTQLPDEKLRTSAYASPTERTDHRRVYAAGIVEGATDVIDLRLPFTGRIHQVLVAEGRQIEKGQTLLRMEDGEFRYQFELAQAELAQASAQLQHVLNSPTKQERSEAAALHQAKLAHLQREEMAWQRISRLQNSGAVADQDADDQLARRSAAAAEAQAAKARLDELTMRPRAEDVDVARARVAAAKAKVELAQFELNRTDLKMPISGRVLRINAHRGEIAGPTSAKPAISIADTTRFRVRAFVEELDAPNIQVGQSAVVVADGLPGQQFAGQVSSVSHQMGPKLLRSDHPDERLDTRTREAWIELDQRAEELVLGLRVDVFIDASESGRKR